MYSNSSRCRVLCALRGVALPLSVLFAILIFTISAFGQSSRPPLITAQGEVGYLAAPGSSTTLTVLVTDRASDPLAGAPVLFVAPESGPGGYFPTAQ